MGSWRRRACALDAGMAWVGCRKGEQPIARMSPPSAKKRGEKSQRGEGAPAGVSKARSPFKRAPDIKSPPRRKKKEEYSDDDEDGRDAAAELSREA